MGDYVGTHTLMQNFITRRLPPFAPQICENVHQVIRLVFLVLPSAYSRNPYTIFTLNSQIIK